MHLSLHTNIVKPYPGKKLEVAKTAYNYRLSRARRAIESSCGILSARWRLFRKPILAEPEPVISYTQAAIALHNFLRSTKSSGHCPLNFIDREDRTVKLPKELG